MSDLRLFPRIKCSFPVYDLAHNCIGKSVNLGFGGLKVEGASEVLQEITSEKTILFFLEDQKEFVEVKVIPLREDKNDFGMTTMAFSFVEFYKGSDELISNYIIGTLWQRALALIGGEGDIQDRFLSKLCKKDEIVQILSHASESNTTFFCFQEEGKSVIPLTLIKIKNDYLIFKSDANPPQAFLHDERKTYITVKLGYSSYFVLTDKLTIKGKIVTIPLPEILFSCARRLDKRENVSDQNMLVCIPLPYPPGAILHRKVINISNGGIAFLNPLNESYFLPGTPIANLKVIGKKEFITKAEIRHITPIKNGKVTALKIGLSFIGKGESFLTGEVKRPSKSGVTNLVRTGGDVFKDLIHFMKGFAVQGIYLAQKSMPFGARNYNKTPPRVDIIRMKNKKNEEIVGILNTTWESKEKKDAYVLIIVPAFGKRKESIGPLALALVENFRRIGEDLAIVRYDGIRNLGESYKEAIYRQPGRETVGMTFSQTCDDIKTVVTFARHNDRFTTKKLILLSFSIYAVPTRRLLAQDALGKVDLWIAGMGAPCVQEVVKTVSGGIDYIGNQAKKIYGGEATILGVTLDQSIFAQDALENKMAFVEDAIKDMKQITTPVAWILGENDAWIETSQVKILLDNHKDGKGQLHVLKMGHVPTNGLEAIRLFNSIFSILTKHFFQNEITPVYPMPKQIDDIRTREWDRTPRNPLVDLERYWAGYLMGEEEEDEGYDILWLCEDYVNFLEDEYRALDLKSNHKVADMGCGTGNFGELLIKHHLNGKGPLLDLTLIDFVPEAIEKAKTKYQALMKERNNSSINDHLFDLEINRLIPVKQFLEGRFFSLDKFKSKINGLYDDTIELWKHHYSDILHQILRGKPLGTVENQYLKETFPVEEIKFVKDMNLAARFLTRSLSNEDLYQTEKLNKGDITTKMLKFHALDFGNSGLNFSLPFEDNQFDRILSSLVLSYLKNPDVTFTEFVRCLKPGGRLVISTMRPDADMSIIHKKILKSVENSDKCRNQEKARLLKSIRRLANKIAQLLTLVEECQFRFFSEEELLAFAEENGLKEVTLYESYGNPPQAYILTGVK
jgi:ubiquinone/menaquinone biosynthesis C-methylase UbiE